MYNAHITRQHKGAIMLLIDQSGSMDEECVINSHNTTKARAVAAIANTFIEEIIDRSHRERGVGDYFDIAIIGYGGEEAKSLFGQRFRRITEFDSMYVPVAKYRIIRKLPTGEHINLFFDQRQWVEPVAKGRTPMGGALRMARNMCAAWCRKHPQSFPPIVINISDGEATDSTKEQLPSGRKVEDGSHRGWQSSTLQHTPLVQYLRRRKHSQMARIGRATARHKTRNVAPQPIQHAPSTLLRSNRLAQRTLHPVGISGSVLQHLLRGVDWSNAHRLIESESYGLTQAQIYVSDNKASTRNTIISHFALAG